MCGVDDQPQRVALTSFHLVLPQQVDDENYMPDLSGIVKLCANYFDARRLNDLKAVAPIFGEILIGCNLKYVASF